MLAVYAIDEARMELVITLAPNYPLGAVKVECGKQIGGRASSRNVGMQLTIFLTHQVCKHIVFICVQPQSHYYFNVATMIIIERHYIRWPNDVEKQSGQEV